MSNISNALKIAEASKEAMFSPHVVMAGRNFLREAVGTTPNDKVLEAFFKYSALLSASCASRVTEVLLTESQMDSMLSDIREVETMERDVFGD